MANKSDKKIKTGSLSATEKVYIAENPTKTVEEIAEYLNRSNTVVKNYREKLEDARPKTEEKQEKPKPQQPKIDQQGNATVMTDAVSGIPFKSNRGKDPFCTKHLKNK